MTLTLLHKRISLLKYVYGYFGLKIHGDYGDITRLSHTVLSGIVSCVGISEQDV